MLLRFSKMHCLGDDLMLVEQVSQHAHIGVADIQRWASRVRGVGFKRLVLIEVPRTPEVDFDCRVFSCDGQEQDCSFIELCCMVRLLRDKKLTARRQLRFSSRNGVFSTSYAGQGCVCVEYPLQGFNELQFAHGWPIELGAAAGGLLAIHQQEQQTDGCLRLELVKSELSLSLFFARQSIELRGWASRVYEGQIKL